MTAEILIMNRLAVALAADSALTIEKGNKIFTSSNKLFALSKYHPVGIMIYGYSELCETPWEVIIKLFRKERKKQSCETISEYFDCFFNFIKQRKDFFQQIFQEEILINICQKIIQDLLEVCYQLFKDNIENNLNAFDVKSIIKNQLNTYYKTFKKTEFVDNYDQNKLDELVSLYDEVISNKINQFSKLTFTKKQKKMIKELVIGSYVKQKIDHDYITGIVIAGYGESEIFPAYKKVIVRGVLNDDVVIDDIDESKINEDTKSCVKAFAQIDMVQNFMEGVNLDYRFWLYGYLDEIIFEFPKKIIDELPLLNTSQKNVLIKKYLSESEKKYEEFIETETYIVKNHYEPILDIVASLPKEELALMAETLINLTMFKRRISMEIESVGGPIDVAIISKIDGFIWIKRKQYFKSELNPAYLRQYYMNYEGE